MRPFQLASTGHVRKDMVPEISLKKCCLKVFHLFNHW
jgi:hypothetical protein